MPRVALSGRLTQEALWVILGQVLTVAGALVGVRILTGLLTPAQYGEVALGLTIASLVNQVIMGPIGAGLSRHYAPASEKGDIAGYLKGAVRTIGTATRGVVLLATITAAILLAFGASEWIWLFLVAFLLALMNGYATALDSIQSAARQRAVVAIHQGAYGWLRYGLAALLIAWLGPASIVVLTAYALASVPVVASQYRFLRRALPKSRDSMSQPAFWEQQVYVFASPLASWGVFTWVQIASDRWALQFFGDTNDVGLYAAVFQIGYYPISIVVGLAIQLLTPIVYQQAGDATDRSRNDDVASIIWRTTWFAFGMTMTVFLVCLFLHRALFQILVAPEYAGVSYLLPWMALAGGVFAASQALSLKLMSDLRNREMVSAKIITALLGIALNILGAYMAGLQGVVVASVILSAVSFVSIARLTSMPVTGM
jgi:O-antigen/teichoic acid export membrane protein